MQIKHPTKNGSPSKSIDVQAIRRDPPLYMSRTEAAAYLGISLRMLAYLLARRELKTIRIGDRRILRLHDLESFLEARAARRH
jgi:excisionase family DNA binding protein